MILFHAVSSIRGERCLRSCRISLGEVYFRHADRAQVVLVSLHALDSSFQRSFISDLLLALSHDLSFVLCILIISTADHTYPTLIYFSPSHPNLLLLPHSTLLLTKSTPLTLLHPTLHPSSPTPRNLITLLSTLSSLPHYSLLSTPLLSPLYPLLSTPPQLLTPPLPRPQPTGYCAKSATRALTSGVDSRFSSALFDPSSAPSSAPPSTTKKS